LKKLSHPNIVELHEVINDDSAPDLFLVMQYLEGTSLDELEEKPTEEEVWKWSRELVSALHMCHIQAKVAHRDIKPENFKLKGKNKDLMLYDFGHSLIF
jgi:[calcium/calmodulin-dependent protein kinase] kinase